MVTIITSALIANIIVIPETNIVPHGQAEEDVEITLDRNMDFKFSIPFHGVVLV